MGGHGVPLSPTADSIPSLKTTKKINLHCRVVSGAYRVGVGGCARARARVCVCVYVCVCEREREKESERERERELDRELVSGL